MPPTLSRRHVLGALGGTVVAGGLASQIPVDTLDIGSPTPGTWPAGRYDAADTRANPHTSVPDDPTIDWQTTDVEGVHSQAENRFVVGVDHVYIGGTHLTALDKHDGTVVGRRSHRVGALAVHDGAVFVLEPERARLIVLDATSGARRWRTPVGGGAGALLVTATHVLTNSSGAAAGAGLTAFDRSDGSRTWSTEHYQSQLLASDPHLYGVHETLVKYEAQRRMIEFTTASGPPIAWEREESFYRPVVVTEGLVIGSVEVPESVEQRTPGVVAFDADTGKRAWGSLWSDRIGLSGDSFDDYAPLTPVVDGARGFTAVRFPDERSRLSSISLTDGAVRWRRMIEGEVTAMAHADDQVIVTTQIGGEERGMVVGVAADDGPELWRVEFDASVQRLAVCDDTVFVGLQDKRVVALR